MPHLSHARSFGLILLIWAAGLGAAAQYGKVSVVFDRLGALYPQAGEAMGIALSLVGLVGILFGVVAGLLVARIRYRRALIWGLAAGGLLSLYQASLPPLGLFMLSRVVEGLSHLAIVAAAPTLISILSPEGARGFTLTLWGTFFGVAFSLLVVLGLPFADRYGVEGLFAAHGAYMLAFAAVLATVLPKREAQLQTPPSPERLTPRAVLARHLTIYRSPFLSAPAIAWLSYTLVYVSLLTLLPRYIAPEMRAFVIGAMPLVSIASSMVLGAGLLRVMPAVRVIQLGFAGALLAALALVVAPGDPLLCLALAVALGLVQGAGFAAVPELNAALPDRALANGALAQTGNLGNTLGTPVKLAMIGLAGHTGMMLAAAAVLGLGITAQIVLGLRRGAA